MEVVIRQEGASDHAIVHGLIKDAFDNEEMSDHREQFLVDRLREAEEFIPQLSLVALIGDKMVGHILFTPIIIRGSKDHVSLALAPVSVHPEFQGQGIGGKLINAGHQVAVESGFESVVLLGHANYYPRFGYEKASDFGVKLPFEVPDENCMAIELVEGALNEVSGEVVYPKAFFE